MQRRQNAAKGALNHGDNFLKGQRDKTHFNATHFSKTSKNETRENSSLKHVQFQALEANSKT